MPPAHPARGMWDTLYLELGEPETVLLADPHLAGADPAHAGARARPSTPSCRARCYRRDTPDARHIPIFHQIEGLVVDRGHLLRRPGRHHRDVHHRLLRSRHPLAAAPVVLPVHRALGRVRDHLHDLPGRGLPHLLADGVDRARRLRHGRSGRASPRWGSTTKSGRASPSASASTGCAQMRHEIPDMRGPARERRPLPAADLRIAVRVPLSWLRDFAPFDGRRRPRSPATLDDLGLVVEEIQQVGEGLERRRGGTRPARSTPSPVPTRSARSSSTPAASRSRWCAGRGTSPKGTSCPWRRWARCFPAGSRSPGAR